MPLRRSPSQFVRNNASLISTGGDQPHLEKLVCSHLIQPAAMR
jgi:hypothetical protein